MSKATLKTAILELPVPRSSRSDLSCEVLTKREVGSDPSPSGLLNTSGFTLVEVLLAMVLIAITIEPMMNAFSPGRTTLGGEEATVFSNQARGTLNRISAMDYATLESYVTTYGTGTINLTNLFTVAGFSSGATQAALEDFTFKGTSYTPAATITDASGGAGGLYELTVVIEYVALRTLKVEY